MVFDRRGFIKFIAGASTGIMVTPVPWKFLDDVSIWSQNWSWIPRNQYGESSYTHVISKMDPSGVPMRVRLVNGRPTRVLPNDSHPLGGGVTALSVAEVQMLHSPARVKRPLLRTGDGGYNELEWPAALKVLQDKLKEAGSDITFISGDENGSTNDLLGALAAKLGSDQMYLMPSEAQCAAVAADLMGLNAQIGYDFENSDYVLSLGANMLESWGTVVRNRRIFQKARSTSYKNGEKENSAPKLKLAYAGPLQNSTAAVADAWLPIFPGTEGILAMGIANLLIQAGKSATASDFAAFAELAATFTPEEVAKRTGVDPKKLEAIVSDLLAAKAPIIVVGSECSHGGGAAPIIAGFALNALLGNINKPGGIRLLPPTKAAVPGAKAREALFKNDLYMWFAAGKLPKMVVLHEANPVYALPFAGEIKKTFAKIPFKVSFSTFMDETAALCDLVLPMPMGIERVDDLETPYGCGKTTYCVTTASTMPQQNARSTGNALIYLCKQMGIDLGGYELFNDVLKAKAVYHESCSFAVLANGQAAEDDTTVPFGVCKFLPGTLKTALGRKAGDGRLLLAPYCKLNLGTAKTGIPPYNNKTLRSSELDGTLMVVMMNGATAKKHNLVDGAAVEIKTADGKRKIPAKLRVFEGVMNDSVGVCLGFGHTALDEFSQNKGANVMELMTATLEPETGLTYWPETSVTVSKA